MFKQASRLKLRFTTNKGLLSVEDLWDLSLDTLDSMASGIDKERKDKDNTTSLIKKHSTIKSKEVEILNLKYSIIEEIITIRLTERELKLNNMRKSEEFNKLNDLLIKKREKSLEDLTEDQILNRMKELKDE